MHFISCTFIEISEEYLYGGGTAAKLRVRVSWSDSLRWGEGVKRGLGYRHVVRHSGDVTGCRRRREGGARAAQLRQARHRPRPCGVTAALLTQLHLSYGCMPQPICYIHICDIILHSCLLFEKRNDATVSFNCASSVYMCKMWDYFGYISFLIS